MLTTIKKALALALRGIDSIELYPNPNYDKNISSVAELNSRAWQLTGSSLRYAMDKVGAAHGGK